MIVIVGLVVLLVAVIVGFTGVLTNAGPAHPLTKNFVVFGYHSPAPPCTLFLFGIVVGMAGMPGMSAAAEPGAPRAAGRRHANSKARNAKRRC